MPNSRPDSGLPVVLACGATFEFNGSPVLVTVVECWPSVVAVRLIFTSKEHLRAFPRPSLVIGGATRPWIFATGGAGPIEAEMAAVFEGALTVDVGGATLHFVGIEDEWDLALTPLG